uniref:Uncharacterized protein n=1 Tax=Phaeomonas parva TaxID=124430 RepID=A0A7S1U6X4_9STRA
MLVDDFEAILEHLDLLDDLVNRHGVIISDEIIQVVMGVDKESDKLKDKVSEAYATFQTRIERVEKKLARDLELHERMAEKDRRQWTERVHKAADAWRPYTIGLLLLLVPYFLGYYYAFRRLRAIAKKRT